MNNNEKIAVLIPAYNEELTIEKVVRDFKKELPNADVYVYNNNSKDNTEELSRNAGAIVVNEYKQGKGNVVRSMFRDIEADIYIMVDADDTYPANEVHPLIEEIRNKKADMVIGDRLSNGTYGKENKRNFHGFGNSLVKNTINSIFKVKLNDIMTGYRVFNRDFVKNFPVLSKGFEIETEMTFHALDRNYRIVEIPITYRDRPEGSESKLNTFSDGFKVIMTIFKTYKNYKPFEFFTILTIMLFLCSLICGVPVILEYCKTGLVEKLPSAVLATGFAIFGALTFAVGVILDTLVMQHKQTLEILRTINKHKGNK